MVLYAYFGAQAINSRSTNNSSWIVTIGQLSEDAQEARNKDIKRYREDFSRECSRAKTTEDIFNRLMVTSDPYISSIRKLPKKKLKSLSREAVQL